VVVLAEGEGPPPRRGRGGRWKEASEKCKRNPGRWIYLGTSKSRSSAVEQLHRWGCETKTREGGKISGMKVGWHVWAKWDYKEER
jgi:hypothetical protein